MVNSEGVMNLKKDLNWTIVLEIVWVLISIFYPSCLPHLFPFHEEREKRYGDSHSVSLTSHFSIFTPIVIAISFLFGLTISPTKGAGTCTAKPALMLPGPEVNRENAGVSVPHSPVSFLARIAAEFAWPFRLKLAYL